MFVLSATGLDCADIVIARGRSDKSARNMSAPLVWNFRNFLAQLSDSPGGRRIYFGSCFTMHCFFLANPPLPTSEYDNLCLRVFHLVWYWVYWKDCKTFLISHFWFVLFHLLVNHLLVCLCADLPGQRVKGIHYYDLSETLVIHLWLHWLW